MCNFNFVRQKLLIVFALAFALFNVNVAYADGCFPLDEQHLVEYYNAPLKHYFYAAPCTVGEIVFIESGGAGKGWSRTGWTYLVYPTGAASLAGVYMMQRYYGSVSPGPNSHFFTMSVEEQRSIEAASAATPSGQPKWNKEGDGFGVLNWAASKANANACGHTILRYYNQGFSNGIDSNHRFLPLNATAERAKMEALGWINEGPVFCSYDVRYNNAKI
jgi:hypothetical protein